MSKMNPEVKRQWVEALRSGKYKQGRGRLATPEGYYCCLGVLCEISPVKGVVDGYGVYYDGYGHHLPPRVQEWAGLSSENPTLVRQQAATLNDTGYSFLEIADLIEEHL